MPLKQNLKLRKKLPKPRTGDGWVLPHPYLYLVDAIK